MLLAAARPGHSSTPLGSVATAFPLVAAFLNAAFGYCLGCELYGLISRRRSKGVSA